MSRYIVRELIGTDANTTSNVMTSLSYRGFGGLKGLNYGANPRKLTLGYNDQRQQMTSMVVQLTSGSDTIISQTYDYHNGGNNNGRIQKITDGVDAAYTTTYSYDDYNRLTAATATAYTRGYSYDEWGNLKTVTASGGGQSGYTINYATNTSGAPSTNRISNVNGTLSYAYDAAGNLTQEGSTTYSYDAASRLKEVGTGGNNTYGYDGDGHRVRKVESGAGAVYYVRSTVLGQVAFETTQTLGAYRAYVYDPTGKLLAQRSTDGQFYWVHKDHLGSGRKLTNSLGTLKYRGEFDPHGQALYEWSDVSTDLNSKKFTGYERDTATGLDYAQARMYHSYRGRYLQPDPARLEAATLTRPQSLNLYSYVENDPVNRVDPTGRNGIFINPCWFGICDSVTIRGGSFDQVGYASWADAIDRGQHQMLDGVRGIDGDVGGGLEPQSPGGRVRLSGDNLAQYQREQNQLLELLENPDSDCARFVLDQLGLSGSRLARAVRGQRAFDATSSTVSVENAGVVPRQHHLAGMSVRDYFEATGAEAAPALYADPSDRGATITDVYYASSGLYAGAILHETLHSFLGIGDVELATRLGIDESYRREQGSRVISWALRDAGCK